MGLGKLGYLLGGVSQGYYRDQDEQEQRRYSQAQSEKKLRVDYLSSILQNPELNPEAIPLILADLDSTISGTKNNKGGMLSNIGGFFAPKGGGISTQTQAEYQASRPGVGQSDLPNPQGMVNAASEMGINPIAQDGELPKGNINFDRATSMTPAPMLPGMSQSGYKSLFRTREQKREDESKDYASRIAAARAAEEPYKKADDERTAQRQEANRKTDLDNRMKVIGVQFQNSLSKMNSQDQLKANLDLNKISNQYIAAGMEPEEAKLQAATILTNQLEARLANTQADTTWKLGQPARAADVANDRERGLALRERGVVVQEQKAQGTSDADQTKIKQFMDDNQQLKNQAIAAYNAATTDNERNQIKAEYDRRARELGESARALLGNNVEIGADASGWYYIKPGTSSQTQSSTQPNSSGQGKTISMDQLRQQAAKGGVDINALIDRAKQRGFTITGQ